MEWEQITEKDRERFYAVLCIQDNKALPKMVADQNECAITKNVFTFASDSSLTQ